MSQHPSSPVRLSFLDGIRALTALYVVLHHVRQATLEAVTHPSPLFLGATAWLRYGHLAVSTFIVLSGFCLALPLAQQSEFDSRRFLARRLQRILPPYYVALLLTLALTDLTNRFTVQIHDPITTDGIIARILLCQDLSTRHLWEWNVPLWSVAVEFRIYLFFPLLVTVQTQRGPGAALTVTTVLSLALTALLPHTWQDLVGPMPQYLALFGFGVFAAHSAPTLTPTHPALRIARWGVLGMAAGVTLLALRWYSTTPLPVPVADIVFGAGAASLLVLLTVAPPVVLLRLLQQRFLVRLGVSSFSLYLLHDPILRFLSRTILPRFGLSEGGFFVVLGVLGVPLTIGLARQFFQWVERPFLNARKPTDKLA